MRRTRSIDARNQAKLDLDQLTSEIGVQVIDQFPFGFAEHPELSNMIYKALLLQVRIDLNNTTCLIQDEDETACLIQDEDETA